VPPLVRSLPHLESLSLFRAEEPQEEADARAELCLAASPSELISHPALALDSQLTPVTEDVTMGEDTTARTELQHLPAQDIQGSGNAVPLPKKPLAIEQPTVWNDMHQPTTFTSASASQLTPPSEQGLEKNATQTNTFVSSPVPQLNPVPMFAPSEGDEDEEMPAINPDSDSDAD